MGEFDLIRTYFTGLDFGNNIELGVGDDAALLRLPEGECLVVSVDTAVAGVHFSEHTLPEVIAYRSIASAVSDLAAMGAKPLGMTLALTLPQQDEWWLRSFSEGVTQSVYAFDCPLVGGDTTRGPLCISITVHGSVAPKNALKRSGAKVGDLIYVSNTLGDAGAGLALELGKLDVASDDNYQGLHDAWCYPQPQLALGQQLAGIASSCIDISDGLLSDLHHILTASQCGAELYSQQIPLSQALVSSLGQAQALQSALNAGEDYQLCFTLPEDIPAPSHATAIGRIIKEQTLLLDGQVTAPAGFTHF
jgi:thiamine-monophosphate kinase